MEEKICLPKLGESIVSATIVRWFKKEGDQVRLDEPLLEVATDKVNSEIPSPCQGVLTKIVAHDDTEVDVGAVLAIIQTQGAVQPEAKALEKKAEPCPLAEASKKNHFLSPSVLRMAGELEIALQDLDKITGTGEGGRVTKKDLEQFAAKKPTRKKLAAGSVDVIKMSPLRKAIAETMTKSFFTAPHASIFTEADITDLLAHLEVKKAEVLAKHGVKLTITSFVAFALTKTVLEYPLLNAEVHQDEIHCKKSVNLGIAVSVNDGVIVPVMRNGNNFTILDFAQKISEISKKVRENQMSREDLSDGSITLTNYGMSGITMGLPILRFPEVAIVGMGAIEKKPKVTEQDIIAIRTMLPLSLTFDHRVFDGMYACSALSFLRQTLENTRFN